MAEKLTEPQNSTSYRPAAYFTPGGTGSLLAVGLAVFGVVFWCTQHVIETAMVVRHQSHPTLGSLAVTAAISVIACALTMIFVLIFV